MRIVLLILLAPIMFMTYGLLWGCGSSHPAKKTGTSATVMTHETFKSDPAFTTQDGISVWPNSTPVTRDMMEDATQFFAVYLFNEERIEIYFTLNAIRHCSIEWTRDLISLGNHPVDHPKGVKVGRQITLLWLGKISASSLFHEWMHAMLFAMHGDADADHNDRWWGEVLPGMKEKAALEGL